MQLSAPEISPQVLSRRGILAGVAAAAIAALIPGRPAHAGLQIYMFKPVAPNTGRPTVCVNGIVQDFFFDGDIWDIAINGQMIDGTAASDIRAGDIVTIVLPGEAIL
jgi:hypothetical protein